MSWSVMYVGSPLNIVSALESYGEGLFGPSKDEFITALPHISALVKLNQQSPQRGLKLNASGSQGYCNVSIETMQSTMV